MTTVPHAVIDKFHSELMDDDIVMEAVMRVALRTAEYYQGDGKPLDDDSMQLAIRLCGRLSVS